MRKLLSMFVAMFMALTAMAATHPLKMGEEFTIRNGGDDVWTITPTETGVMKIVGVNGDGDWIGSCLNVYDDAAMTNQIQSYNWTCYEMPVTAGHTYYIKTWNFTGQDFRGKCVMAGAFTFTGSNPAEGEMFHIVGDSECYLYFSDSNVSFTEGELSCNGHIIKIYNYTDFNYLVSSGIFTYTEVGSSGLVNYNGCVLGHTDNEGLVIPFITQTGYAQINVLYEMLSSGQIETGQPMTLNLHGVKSDLTNTLLNGDGELEMHWKVGEMPTKLEKATLPSTFLSYWAPGDPDGYATFEFSREIRSAKAMIAMGYADADDRFEGEVPVIVSGNTVKIDFTGLRRDANSMGLKKTYPTMEITLYHVIDINGNGTHSEGQGTASSYSYTCSYRDVSGEVSFDITPASGTTLTADHKTIEIWYNDPSKLIEADGVDVSYYTANGEMQVISYARKDLSWTDASDGTTILVPVTDAMRNNRNVCVRLNVTVSRDGREHAIVAYYNTALSRDWDIEPMADPVSGSTINRLAEIFFTLNSTYSINTTLTAPATVLDESGNKVATGHFERDGMTNVRLVLSKSITDEGIYTVTVAEGAVGDYVYGDSHYVSGLCNPQFSLNYIVTGNYAGRSMVTDPEEGNVSSLSTIRLIAFDWNAVAPSWNVECTPYVERADGSQVLAMFSDAPQEASNIILLTLEKTITEPGDVVLVVPSGALTNAATGDPIQSEFRFNYTVTMSDCIAPLRPTHNTQSAYNLAGQRIRATHPGLRILDGKKLITK